MQAASTAAFDPLLRAWSLAPDGKPIATDTSRLLPVRTQDGDAAIIKVALVDEERHGADLMAWWDGVGAARILARNGDAILLERAMGPASLVEMAGRSASDDDRATRILCATVATLHDRRGSAPAGLVPLKRWLADLSPAAAAQGGLLGRCAEGAAALLAERRDVVPLHGDVHHGNVLDFGRRGWLAIDPKGLIGDRAFDYANIFCNPDASIATAPGRLARQVGVASQSAGIDRARLLRWIMAWSALSNVWMVADSQLWKPDLSIARIAAEELDKVQPR